MIKKNLELIQHQIAETASRCGRDPSRIKLVAVSKRFPAESIVEANNSGQHLFGENYIQEAEEKKAILGDRIKLHFIGHLQSNKAKTAAEIFDMIETVDRYKIAASLNRHLAAANRTLDILIQVNIGRDPKKSGVPREQAADLLKRIKDLDHLNVKGLMTIPPATNSAEASRPFFSKLQALGTELQQSGLLPSKEIELSMGMSNDFHVAIEEGATLIRVGTAVFGKRPTN